MYAIIATERTDIDILPEDSYVIEPVSPCIVLYCNSTFRCETHPSAFLNENMDYLIRVNHNS